MASKQKKNLVHVRVTKHLSQGLYVRLDNGRSGIIRLREISWKSENAADWKTSYPVGWSGFAFNIPKQKGDAHELSLRLADNDPWDDVPTEIEKNQIFEGVVTSVVDYGAFIEISDGLTGLLHQTQIPAWCQNKSMDLFWPGDKVFVVIKEIDHELRRISFGIPPVKYLIDAEQNHLTITSMPRVVWDMASGVEKLLEANAPRKHILVVEDEEAQATAVAGWLRKLGQRVDVVNSAENAIDFLEKTQPDIVLADVGLPGISGTELAMSILQRWPDIKVVSTTDWARADDIMDTLEDLQAHGAKLLIKPLLPEDLVAFLLQEQKQERKQPHSKGAIDEKLTLTDIPKLSASKSIQALLQQCRKHLNCEQVILFALDPIHRKTTIVERSGGDSIINKNALAYLVYSPVRDAAEDREAVIVNEINEQEHNRFRYLLELCPTTVACIGVPVPTQMPFDYALFALDKRPRMITNEQQIYAEGMALAIGASLDHNNLMEKFILMQRTALIGHLTRAMMHEINNLVGPLLYESEVLKESLAKVSSDPNQSNYENVHNGTKKIQQDVRKIVATTKIFGRIVAKGKDEVLRVDEIVQETLSLLRDISDRAHVVMQSTPPEKLIVVRSQAVILEQIFLNVVLNAIQQIAELRPDIGGWVQINTELKRNASGAAFCRILFEDNGPGIHTSHWEKIFDAGFTTRPDGSGIGLYISRNLLENLGGRIYITKSHILSGTSFALEFPVHV
jgi:signal transduction histidine kinase/DNA-binding response OmpR family regulator/predicted RNA-binding protein with RPS1 domain